METLDLQLQFFFVSGQLNRVHVTVPGQPIVTVTGGSFSLPYREWRPYTTVRLAVNASDPPVHLGYTLNVNGEPHRLDSPTMYCDLELPQGRDGGQFVVEATDDPNNYPVTVTFEPAAAGGVKTAKMPIIVGPTPKPPINPPMGKWIGWFPPKMKELIELLHDNEIVRELERMGPASPVGKILQTARSVARRLDEHTDEDR